MKNQYMPDVLVPSCRLCGAPSYRRVISRDAEGRMVGSGLYQCSGCSAIFADPKSWREGGDETPTVAGPVTPLTPVSAASAGRTSSSEPFLEGPNLATYGMTARPGFRDRESGR